MVLRGSIPTILNIGKLLVNILKRCGEGLPSKLRLLHGPGLLMQMSLTIEQELPRETAALPTEAASNGLQYKGRHPVFLKCVSRFIKELP